mgnify:CR=1 FL=1
MNRPVHFGYVIFNEGTPNQNVRVLLAASAEGLEAQARLFKLRLRGDDYVNSYDDLEDYDEECIAELEE